MRKPTPQRIAFLVLGAVAILALLTLGAFLFSSASDAGPCDVVLSANHLAYHTAQASEAQQVELPQGAQVQLIQQTADWWGLRYEDRILWMPLVELDRPALCNP